MKKMKEKFKDLVLMLLVFFAFANLLQAQKREAVKVESLLGEGRISILSKRSLKDGEYQVYTEHKRRGTLNVIESKRVPRFDGYAFTHIVEIDEADGIIYKAGFAFFLEPLISDPLPTYSDKFNLAPVRYKPEVLSDTDGRPMVFVEGGITLIGSDVGDSDEKPVHKVIVDSFYIDKYEVSNREYLVFVKEGGGRMPLSWENQFPQELCDYPVLVSYYEAQDYARWAGKMLPSEYEWERAANGVAATQKTKTIDGLQALPFKTQFPWGNDFVTGSVNCREFWGSDNSLAYKFQQKKGLLPIETFSNSNLSYYGLVNMSGNAAEWTNSWYQAYPGNNIKNRRFGKQVKVVKGGSWHSTMSELTVSSRSFGGVPNLETDNRFGFRCVRRPNTNDLLKE